MIINIIVNSFGCMKLFMKSIEISFRYWGDWVNARVHQKKDAGEMLFPIELNGDYLFTLRYDQHNKWIVVKERNGLTPKIDRELLNRILKPLERKMELAA